MELEPLKNKVRMMKTGHNQKLKVKAVRIEYIKSAVEWLKERLIKKMETKYKGKVCYPYTYIGDTIDKAFEDVVK